MEETNLQPKLGSMGNGRQKQDKARFQKKIFKIIKYKTLEIAQFSENFEEKIIICHILKKYDDKKFGRKFRLSARKFDLTPTIIKNVSLQFSG